jgi:hypothetical protein
MIIYNQNLWFVDIQFAHARAQSDAIALEYETDKLCLIPQGAKTGKNWRVKGFNRNLYI